MISSRGRAGLPARVLLAHNYYRSSAPSGEDAAFDNERRLLEDAGLIVIPFIRRNDELDDSGTAGRIRIAFETTWSRRSFKELTGLIDRYRPDIAHFHNTFPQISPSAYLACRRRGVPVVQTLHNYRLVCAGALLQRAGQPCEECVGGRQLLGLWPALRHRCYRGSLAATGALTAMLAANRAAGSYRRNVDHYIALTRFAASRLQAGGLPADRFSVKPNFLPDAPRPGAGRGGYAVYVGRLSAEKGVLTLLQAWQRGNMPPLKIVGGGSLEGEMRRFAHERRLDVEFLGFRSRADVLRIVGDAAVQIVPSECYEGFPMVILEAFASGTPVVASRIGSLEEIVTDGINGEKFPAGVAEKLAVAVQRLTSDADRLTRMRCTVRQTFDGNYTAERNRQQLLAVYERVALAGRRGPFIG